MDLTQITLSQLANLIMTAGAILGAVFALQKWGSKSAIETKDRYETAFKSISERQDTTERELCARMDYLEACTLSQQKQINDSIKQREILVYGMSAVLQGLIEQGCNGEVHEAKDVLDNYLKSKPFEMD